MLVLSRKVGESITIDNNIKITVMSVGGGRVRLGIDAPKSVQVDRSEIKFLKDLEQQSPVVDDNQVEENCTRETECLETAETPLPLHNRISTVLPPISDSPLRKESFRPRKPR